ncbi:MAG TPA: helix-hairpin-helix domain-containing protein [bacterium]|nr:helix-hairpin-helix domain-containing protein [bacterium]
MKHSFSIITSCLLLSLSCHAAFEDKLQGARPQGMGGAYTAVADDVLAVFYNPAGLRLANTTQLAFSQTQLFNMEQLALKGFAFALPTMKLGTLAVAYEQFGFTQYQETQIYIADSFHLGRGLYTGFSFKTMNVEIEEYGIGTTSGLDVGFLANVSESFRFGFSLANINNPAIGNSTESPQKTMKAGMLYQPREELRFALDLWKPIEKELETRLGTEIALFPSLFLRLGIKSQPNRFSLGLGWNWNRLGISYSYLTHSYLDAQNQFTVQFYFMRGSSSGRGGGESSVEEAAVQRYDLNAITLKQLLKLPKMNRKTAQNIIAYRKSKGSFNSSDELLTIKGISKKEFRNLNKYLYVEGSGGEEKQEEEGYYLEEPER